MGGSFTGAVAF